MERLTLKVTIDRPKGFVNQFGTRYPVNCGFVEGVISNNGEPQTAYVLANSVTVPLESFVGRLVAVIHRHDDQVTQWVVTATGEALTKAEILRQTYFLEQDYESSVEMLA